MPGRVSLTCAHESPLEYAKAASAELTINVATRAWLTVARIALPLHSAVSITWLECAITNVQTRIPLHELVDGHSIVAGDESTSIYSLCHRSVRLGTIEVVRLVVAILIAITCRPRCEWQISFQGWLRQQERLRSIGCRRRVRRRRQCDEVRGRRVVAICGNVTNSLHTIGET